MIGISYFVLEISPIEIKPPEIIIRNKYAEVIPYDELYKVENRPNKSTLEYNTMNFDEMIKSQNEKIINEIFYKDQND